MHDDELSSQIEAVLRSARFRVSGAGEDLDAGAFRSGYESATNRVYFERHEPRPSDFVLADTQLDRASGCELDRLRDWIRDLTAAHADDTGNFQITVPLPNGSRFGAYSHPYDLARRVVRCAALHGTADSVELLLELFQTGSIPYERIVVLAGAKPARGHSGFEILPRVRLIDFRDESLPGSRTFETFPESLLFSDADRGRMRGFAQPTVQHHGALQFDLTHENAVTCAEDDGSIRPDDGGHRLIYDYGDRDSPSNELVDALSLIGGYPVTEVWAWHRFDVRLCTLVGYRSQAYRYVQRSGHMSKLLTPADVPALQGIRGKLQTERGERLRPLIRRWGKITVGEDLVEIATDLRVTLEALFLDEEDRRDRGKRAARRGSWYLNGDQNDAECFGVIRDAYKLCSRALHRGGVEPEDQDETLRMIEAARRLCHQALLKRVHEQEQPNWKELDLVIAQEAS